MGVVGVVVGLAAVPLPSGAAIEVIGGHCPVGIVVQHDTARAVIDSAGDEDAAPVLGAAEGISAARTNALVVIVPIAGVLADPGLLPTFLLSVFVRVFIAAPLLVPPFLLAFHVMSC